MGRMELGGSLAVANVQQLASTSNDVPDRYIRTDLELDLDLISNDQSIKVPIIDMSKLMGDGRDHEDELDKLHAACRDWGFFQVINHGVVEDVISKMQNAVQEFFNHPLQEKMEYAQLANSIEGYGQAFVVSEEQKLDWGDMLFIIAQPPYDRNMRFWPKSPPSFRENLEQYSAELKKLTARLLSSMAKNLGLQPEKLLTLFKQGTQGVRMNYYPPCKEATKVIGLAPHSDTSGLTLLIQVNEVQGLQIRRCGKWVPVIPIPGAFIINVGDAMEIMSNGQYKSIEHRVVVNPEKERLSIAAFHSPNFNATIGPLPDILITKDQKEEAPKYKSISHADYIKLRGRTKLDGKGFIHHMKIQTEAEGKGSV